MKYIAWLLLIVSGAANAVIVTIDADDYAIGTVIGPTPDAAISYLNHKRGEPFFTYRAAIAALEPTCILYTVCAASTGTQVLSDGTLKNGQLQPHGTGELINIFYGGLTPGQPGKKLDSATMAEMRDFYAMRVDFSSPTDFFAADLYGEASDTVFLLTFDREGTFLSNSSSTANVSIKEMGPDCTPSYACRRIEYAVQQQHDTADIAFVIYGSISSVLYPDAIRFNVPEPSAFALFGLGLLGLAASRVRVRRWLAE